MLPQHYFKEFSVEKRMGGFLLVGIPGLSHTWFTFFFPLSLQNCLGWLWNFSGLDHCFLHCKRKSCKEDRSRTLVTASVSPPASLMAILPQSSWSTIEGPENIQEDIDSVVWKSSKEARLVIVWNYNLFLYENGLIERTHCRATKQSDVKMLYGLGSVTYLIFLPEVIYSK